MDGWKREGKKRSNAEVSVKTWLDTKKDFE